MKKLIGKRNLKFVILILILLAISSIFLFKGNQKHQNQIPSSPSPSASPLYNDFHLILPSLDIQAPVIADVDGSNQTAYDKALEGGVAQLQGSSKPGDGSNIFIFGHSSFYWYKPGNYKEVFKNLDKLKTGDEVILWYNQKEHKYIVFDKKTVWPNQVDVLKPTSQEQVSLMTCVPPGTTLKRLIVLAKPE